MANLPSGPEPPPASASSSANLAHLLNGPSETASPVVATHPPLPVPALRPTHPIRPPHPMHHAQASSSPPSHHHQQQQQQQPPPPKPWFVADTRPVAHQRKRKAAEDRAAAQSVWNEKDPMMNEAIDYAALLAGVSTSIPPVSASAPPGLGSTPHTSTTPLPKEVPRKAPKKMIGLGVGDIWWNLTLRLPPLPSVPAPTINLSPRAPLDPLPGHRFIMEDSYSAEGRGERALFSALTELGARRIGSWNYPTEPPSAAMDILDDCYRFKKLLYFRIREMRGEHWYIYLRIHQGPGQGQNQPREITAYLARWSDLYRVLTRPIADMVTHRRKLPLVIDVIGVLVKVLPDGVDLEGERIKTLGEGGRRVQLAPGAGRFLRRISSRYEVVLCSSTDAHLLSAITSLLTAEAEASLPQHPPPGRTSRDGSVVSADSVSSTPRAVEMATALAVEGSSATANSGSGSGSSSGPSSSPRIVHLQYAAGALPPHGPPRLEGSSLFHLGAIYPHVHLPQAERPRLPAPQAASTPTSLLGPAPAEALLGAAAGERDLQLGMVPILLGAKEARQHARWPLSHASNLIPLLDTSPDFSPDLTRLFDALDALWKGYLHRMDAIRASTAPAGGGSWDLRPVWTGGDLSPLHLWDAWCRSLIGRRIAHRSLGQT